MASNAQKYRINRVVDAKGNIVPVHPETDAGQVLYENAALGDDIKNVDDALGALADLATSSGVTGVKGAAESSYRKGNVNLTPANIGAVASNDAITAGTFTKVAVDTKGLVTGGSQATLDDIADGSTRKLSNYIPTSQKGANGGVATLDSTGKVPTSQLPSYVDDVLEYENLSGFPTTGSAGKIYVDKQTNKTYRWGGSGYTEISASLALGETSSTAYAGDKGKQNADDIEIIKNGFAKVLTGETVVGLASNAFSLGGVAANQYAKLTDIPEDKLLIVNGTATEASYTKTTLDKTYDEIVAAIAQGKLVVLAITDTTNSTINYYYHNKRNQQSGSGIQFLSETGSTAYTITVSSTGISRTTAQRIISVNFGNSGTIITSMQNQYGTLQVTRRAMQNSDLPDSGVVVNASTGISQYSAVNVNSKGVVVAGGNSIEWGTKGQTAPSDSLMVGGLFFELVE